MPLVAVAVVPAAPLLVPEASPAQPEEFVASTTTLRHLVADILEGLPPTATVLMLLAGDESLVIDASVASLASYGLPQVAEKVRIDGDLIAAVSARGQAPRVRSDRLHGDAAVLALLLAAHHPDATLAPVTVPRRANASGLRGIAMGLAGAIAAVERDVVVVAAGDLAATLDASSPGYLVEGAADWDARAVAAVRSVDPEALGALGPDEAERVHARGWAPVTVALTLARGADIEFPQVRYLAPKGVGQIVAG